MISSQQLAIKKTAYRKNPHYVFAFEIPPDRWDIIKFASPRRRKPATRQKYQTGKEYSAYQPTPTLPKKPLSYTFTENIHLLPRPPGATRENTRILEVRRRVCSTQKINFQKWLAPQWIHCKSLSSLPTSPPAPSDAIQKNTHRKLSSNKKYDSTVWLYKIRTHGMHCICYRLVCAYTVFVYIKA